MYSYIHPGLHSVHKEVTITWITHR